MKRSIIPVVLLALVAGCDGDGQGADASSEAPVDVEADGLEVVQDVDDELPAPTHETDIQPIWTVRCAPCHVGDVSGGLDLSPGSAYGNVVDVPAAGLPSMDRIEPGSTADSYLWHKVSGTQASVGGSGSTMPVGGSLTAHERDLLERWIEAGAPE